ncbi:MAG: hypothetical protein WBW93_11815 [Steroidobacteraceae bacterium]
MRRILPPSPANTQLELPKLAEDLGAIEELRRIRLQYRRLGEMPQVGRLFTFDLGRAAHARHNRRGKPAKRGPRGESAGCNEQQ